MTSKPGLKEGTDGVERCWWCAGDRLYEDYHDTEWGRPQDDDRRLFEKIVLEGFQSGLSWITILKKRQNFRAAFNDFDMEVISKFGARDVNRLVSDAGSCAIEGRSSPPSTMPAGDWSWSTNSAVSPTTSGGTSHL